MTEHHVVCLECGKHFVITINTAVSAMLILGHWLDELGGKCKDCLERERAAA